MPRKPKEPSRPLRYDTIKARLYPTVYTTKDGIRMTKAGVVKAKFPRRPRDGWKLKRITVDRTKSGKYFCSILYEYPAEKPEPVLPTEEKTLGLKYSMAHFYVDSEGNEADPPHWLKESQEKLAKLQRRLSRMEPGSGKLRSGRATAAAEARKGIQNISSMKHRAGEWNVEPPYSKGVERHALYIAGPRGLRDGRRERGLTV